MTSRTIQLAVLGVVSLSLAVPAYGASSARHLIGAVSPNGLVSVRTVTGGHVVQLRPGIFVITVRDRSTHANFHLLGNGGFTKATGVRFTGTVTWRVTLAPGTYSYLSDRTPLKQRVFTVR